MPKHDMSDSHIVRRGKMGDTYIFLLNRHGQEGGSGKLVEYAILLAA